ncbi:tetratricopeptide repeat protein [Rhizobium mongolense]|uniref:tetratricopeptide repeat protein n=1 Tax=Rhizobium mongolense TaxID=57676 RepID=UPI000B81656E
MTTRIGDLHFYGKGVPQDYHNARQWYERGADRGDGGAMFRLARMYRPGKGVEKNPTIALEWFRKAADMRVPQPLNQLNRKRYGPEVHFSIARFGICSSSRCGSLTRKMRRKTQMQAEGATRKLRAKRSKY